MQTFANVAKTTITDIAKKLGLTPSTISRALAGNPRIKIGTREAVEKAAAEMGYERNAVASSLRSGKAMTVGIIVPRINRMFFGNAISGAESVLNEAGYTVIICQTHEKVENEKNALKTLGMNRVAGILISHSIESADSSHIREALDGRSKLVQFDRVFYDLPGAKVVNDNFHGAYEATSHLLRMGYKKIGTLAGYMNVSCYKERLDGYFKALSDAGTSRDESLVYYGSILQGTGRVSGKKAIEAGCDALYSAGDFSALGAVEAAREAGKNIPEDFGIVGTANEDFTSIMNPPLSSLDLNPYEIGRQAALAFLDGSDEVVKVKTELRERLSSKRNGNR